MALELPFGYKQTTASANIDEAYGPYNSLSEAIIAVPVGLRALGRVVGIIESGRVVDYVWESGIQDTDLVLKVTKDDTKVDKESGKSLVSDSEIDKLEGLKTQQEIDEDIVNATVNASANLIKVSGTVLPRGANVPAYITQTGKAELSGGNDPSGITYTNTGTTPSSFTVPQGSVGYAYYTRSTDSWELVTTQELPKTPVADEYGNSTSEAASQRLVTSLKEDFDEKISIVTNEEFIYAIVDQNEVLLWGKRHDGSTYDCDLSVYEYTAAQITSLYEIIDELTSLTNDRLEALEQTAEDYREFETNIGNLLSVISNEEFVYAIVDSSNTLLWGKRRDGSTYDCDKKIPTKLDNLSKEISITNIKTISNEEYLYAIVDSNNTLLWGKKRDGSTYDCDLSVYKYTDTQVSALNQLIGDLTVIVNTISSDYLPKSAVKDETGSSTADTISQKLFSDFKTWVDNKLSIITNEEFVYAIVDQNNVLLWGKRLDGSTYDCDKEISLQLESLSKEVAITNIKTISNEEFIYAIVTADNVLLWGKRHDGTTYDCDDLIERELETLKLKVALLEGRISVISDNDFIYAIVTSDNTILWGKRRDGSTYDCDVTLPNELEALKQKISFYEGTINKVDTPEYLSVTVDKEEQIIEAILRDGTKFLQALKTDKIETDSLKLSDSGMSQLQKDLKDAGFTSGTGDWSDEENLRLPIPRVPAKINLIVPKLPITKTEDIEGEMEYYDIDGNFFKKKIVINAQGNSSMAYIKKNFSLDLDDGSKIKFGDWVEQDSWHMKAHYTDSLKSNNNVAYDLFETLARNHRPYDMSRVWDTEFKQGQTTTSGVGKFIEDHDTGARGFPDGFPTTVYHNGEFHGIYMFNLKKHRDNYKMDRGNENHIHLDGEIGYEELFNGTIDWTKFEIRNPKPRQKKEGWELLTLSGDEYDGDDPTELGNTGKTLDVKLAIQRLAESVTALRDTPTKQVFESYFSNTWMFADYLIIANLVANGDSFRKNWQWVTYNGGNTWTIAPYDWDIGLGVDHIGNFANAPSSHHLVGDETPMHYFWLLYEDEVKARYQELRESGFLTAENIFSFYKKRIDWIGAENFEKELEKWPETPSYRESGLNDNWSLKSRTITTDPINYDPDVDYIVGDEVVYGLDSERYVFVNKTGSKGEPPLDLFYTNYPRTFGFYNSVTRVYLWLKERINKLDTIYQIN